MGEVFQYPLVRVFLPANLRVIAAFEDNRAKSAVDLTHAAESSLSRQRLFRAKPSH